MFEEQGKEARPMQIRKLLFCCLCISAGGGFVVLSLGHGQDRSITPVSASPASASSPPAIPPATTERFTRQFSKLPPLQQQMYLSAQRGADWLCRTNQADGRFVNGYLPALRAS